MRFAPPAYAQLGRAARPVVRALYRLQVVGAERVPATGPLVVTANHESAVDGFVLGTAIERELRFLVKAELWRWRALAWILDGLGAIAVARGRGDREALERARQALEVGQAVALFPQGTVRSRGPWQRGAAKLALVTGAPVLPVRLVGTAGALSRGRIGFPRLRVVIGEPLRVERAPATIAAARVLTERIQAAVEPLA